MNKKFKDEIKKLINKDEILFYNGSGNVDAFKLCVRHVSSAASAQKAIMIGKDIHPFDTLIIVDFENEKIYETEDKIKIIPLKFLK